MSKESAVKFLRGLKTNEKAKELLQGREKPKSKEDVIKAYVEVAAELGERISAEDLAAAMEALEAEIHQKTEAAASEMKELNDDEVGNVAGGEKGCVNDYEGWCWLNDMCHAVNNRYDCIQLRYGV